jgi:hypothetical protein
VRLIRPAVILVTGMASAATIPIASVETTLVLGSSSTAAGFTFQGNQLRVDALYTGSGATEKRWRPVSGLPTVNVQRFGANNPNRNIGWVAVAAGTALATQPPVTTDQIARNDLYQVVDNVFVNDRSTNSTNIERVDFVLPTPAVARSDRSVVVMERGATGGHDAFAIAAILEVDSTGAPSRYGSLLKIPANWANGVQYTLSTGNGEVFYRDVPGGTLTASAPISGQVIAGLMIPLTDLTALGNAVYGYSLFGNDVATNATLTRPDLFSRTTSSGNGGIDLVAMNLGVVQEVPEASTLFTAVSALCALVMLRRWRR